MLFIKSMNTIIKKWTDNIVKLTIKVCYFSIICMCPIFSFSQGQIQTCNSDFFIKKQINT